MAVSAKLDELNERLFVSPASILLIAISCNKANGQRTRTYTEPGRKRFDRFILRPVTQEIVDAELGGYKGDISVGPGPRNPVSQHHSLDRVFSNSTCRGFTPTPIFGVRAAWATEARNGTQRQGDSAET